MTTQPLTDYDEDLPDFDNPAPPPPVEAMTMTMTIQDRARQALAQQRAAYQAEQIAKAREEEQQTAQRIVKRSLGLDVTADGPRVTIDGVTLIAYTRYDYDSYSHTDYLRLVAPCPHCGEETVGPNMADRWGSAWVKLGEQIERFTPDSSDHFGGRCARPGVEPSNPPPAQALPALLDKLPDFHAMPSGYQGQWFRTFERLAELALTGDPE